MPVYSQSSLPTVLVVDANGEGAAAQMQSPSSLPITSQGDDYTLDATLYMRGGRPASWDSPPIGSVSINQSTGKITDTITWQTIGQGNGVFENGAYADVYLDGGGGSEGSLLPVGTLTARNPPQLIGLNSAASFWSRSFSSPPRVIVVTREKPAHRQRRDVSFWYFQRPERPLLANQLLALNQSLPLVSAAPESMTSESTSPAAIFRDVFSSWRDPTSSVPFGDGWNLFMHYWDGQVDFVWIGYPSQARATDLSSAPAFSFSLGGEGGGASAHSEFVGWTGYFSDFRAVRIPPT
jgi:hypothetical protein